MDNPPDLSLRTTSDITNTHIQMFMEYLAWCKETTKDKYRYALKLLQGFDVPFDYNILSEYDQRGNTRTLITRMSEIAGLKRFIWFAQYKNWIPEFSVERAADVLRNSRGGQRVQYTPRLPDMDACRKIVDFWLNPATCSIILKKHHKRGMFYILRNRALMLTLISSGGRVSEVMNLTVSQMKDGSLKAWIKGKKDLWRWLLISPQSSSAIQEYLVERERIFPDAGDALWLSWRGLPYLHGEAIADVIEKTEKLMGVEHKVYPHMFRHYLATDMLHHGVKPEHVQKALGHTALHTTMHIYAHVLDTDFLASVEKYRGQSGMGFSEPPRELPPPPPVPFPPPPTSPPVATTVWVPDAFEWTANVAVASRM